MKSEAKAYRKNITQDHEEQLFLLLSGFCCGEAALAKQTEEKRRLVEEVQSGKSTHSVAITENQLWRRALTLTLFQNPTENRLFLAF